jgi:dipeptidyl aminopeptidase/acylaminoacyl peptidase
MENEMMKPLDLSEDVLWKRRYRAPGVIWTQIARRNPARGLVCTNKDGIYQLYAWDVASGTLNRLTTQPAGVVGGVISPDGETIYYLRDEGGNDTRCPARQMHMYEDTLRSLGKSITLHWFDAGHGSRAMNQQIEHQQLMLQFAYNVVNNGTEA